jgi:rhodanese-related sulfurtransferase
MKPVTIFLLIATAILVGVLLYNRMGYSINNDSHGMRIGPQEAKARRFGLILDVRSHKERELYGAYPNSVIIPFEELTLQSVSDLVSKDTSILIYCKKGTRASQAAVMLKNGGFKNVKYIDQPYTSMMPPGTF